MLLAIDASPAERIEQWIADGSLPNLAALRARGTLGRIEFHGRLSGRHALAHLQYRLTAARAWLDVLFDLAARSDAIRPADAGMAADRPVLSQLSARRPTRDRDRRPDHLRRQAVQWRGAHGWGTHDKIGRPRSFPAGLAERMRREIGPPPIADEAAGRQSAGAAGVSRRADRRRRLACSAPA